VKRGVELGYRVIDDYIKQGTAVANSFAGPTKGQVPSTQDLPKMAERMMQYGSDFASIWFDAMAVMISNFDGTGPGARPAGFPPPGQSPPPVRAPTGRGPTSRSSDNLQPPPRLSLEIRCSQAIEVLVTLDEPISSSTFVVEDLRARSGSKKIKGAALEMPESPAGAIRIRIQVPSRTPSGRYSGAILDAVANNPRGRLTVIVGQ